MAKQGFKYNKSRLNKRLYVGAKGNYTTLKEAVDWFNASAESDYEILLDAGNHAIADTITVNNGTYHLQIRGLGSAVTHLNAATGLTGKPMFNIKSSCDLNKISCYGSTLASYGTLTNENGVTFDTTASLYSEITDIIMDTFKIGVADLIGAEIFMFNFIVANCAIGYQVNYSTAAITTLTDIEVGNFENCAIGIDLLKATEDAFNLDSLIFANPVAGVAVKYTGGAGNYIYTDPAKINNCTYNFVGEMFSGFDFAEATGRDTNIELMNNIGEENKTPHAKINVADNVGTTTVTTAGVYYKANFTNGIVYNCKIALDNNKMTFLSDHPRDGMMWVAGNLSVNQTNRNITVGMRKSLNIASVTGNGATITVTTSTSHHLKTGAVVQMLGWTGGTGTWNGTYSITRVSATVFTYTANGNGTATGGTAGAIMSPFTVRTATTNQPYGFSLVIYADGMAVDEDYEIYLTSGNSGDVVTVQDINWLLDTR